MMKYKNSLIILQKMNRMIREFCHFDYKINAFVICISRRLIYIA